MIKLVIKKIMPILLILMVQGCDNIFNKCKDLACFSPPIPINLELIDDHTRENIFTSGVYTPDELMIIDNSTGSLADYSFNSETNIIELGPIAWDFDEEIFDYAISIPSKFEFVFYVEGERVTEDCCNSTRILEQNVSNYEFENSSSSEIIIVYIK